MPIAQAQGKMVLKKVGKVPCEPWRSLGDCPAVAKGHQGQLDPWSWEGRGPRSLCFTPDQLCSGPCPAVGVVAQDGLSAVPPACGHLLQPRSDATQAGLRGPPGSAPVSVLRLVQGWAAPGTGLQSPQICTRGTWRGLGPALLPHQQPHLPDGETEAQSKEETISHGHNSS